MRSATLLLSFVAVFVHNTGLTPIGQQNTATEQTTEQFIARWKDPKYEGVLGSAAWTLIHGYHNYQHITEVLKSLEQNFIALDAVTKNDDKPLKTLGGIKAFKDHFAVLLTDKEQCVRAFAAIVLGICGDKTYAPEIAKLLAPNPDIEKDDRYDRARAATALGILNAEQYTDAIVKLLDSTHTSDRIGALYGLGWMKARQQTPAVMKLLKDEEADVRKMAQTALRMIEEKP